MVPLSFASRDFFIVGETALFWPSRSALLVADLHFEKASYLASNGQMLPPYDSIETLERLERLLDRTGARAVYCLGDSFHDGQAEDRLCGAAADLLASLCGRRDWVWICGNHDPDVSDRWGGRIMEECELDGIRLCHRADSSRCGPEVSGHYHPKLRVGTRGRNVTSPCFLASQSKLILPAFGAFTGGMSASDPAIFQALGQPDRAYALVEKRNRLLTFELFPEASAHV